VRHGHCRRRIHHVDWGRQVKKDKATPVDHLEDGTIVLRDPDWSHIPHDCWIVGCVGGEIKRKLDCFDLIVRALEKLTCPSCGNRIDWTGQHGDAQRSFGRTDWRHCAGCKEARTLLAAAKATSRPSSPKGETDEN